MARMGGLSALQHNEPFGAPAPFHQEAKKERQTASIRVSPLQSREEATSQDRAKRLWKEVFEDPTQRRDRKPDKINPTGLDLRDAATEEQDCSDNRLKLAWMQGRIKAVEDENADACRANGVPGRVENGVVLTEDQEGADRVWKEYFKDPTEWWDKRKDKLHLKDPDFLHKITKKALWVDSCGTPQWVTEELTKQVDSRSPERDEHSWTALISQHVKGRQCKQALKMYGEMQEYGVKPSSYTIVAVLKACSSLKDLESTKRIHADVVGSGLESDVYVGTMLLDVYAKCGSLRDARQVFEKMPYRNVVSWNAMTLAYAQTGQGEEALQLFARMQREGVLPDDRSFLGALKACSTLAAVEKESEADGILVKRQCLEQVRAIHSQVENKGIKLDVFVGSTLVDLYAKCGSLVDARCVFENMPYRNVVSWTAMILAYAQREKGEVALELYARMQQEGIVPDAAAFVSALKGCSSLAASEGIGETEAIAVKQRCLEHVRLIHSQVVKSGFDSNVVMGTMLVDAYAKCGSIVDARHVFQKMPYRNVASWNAMISGYAQTEDGKEALQLYTRMQQEGVVPDDRTFVAALKACGSLATLEEGIEADEHGLKSRCLEQVKGIHAHVVKSGSEESMFVGSILLIVYAKCGSLVDARSVFERMPDRNVVSWNAMIFGYIQVDEGDEALQLYARMQQDGAVPDDRTFVGALKACRSLTESDNSIGVHGILVKGLCMGQLRAIHSHAWNSGFKSDVHVATMLVDAYAKCGSLVDARFVFDNMPNRNVVSWNVMILGYTQMEEGEEALNLYARMQQENVVPDELTFVGALKGCSSLAGIEEAAELGGILVKQKSLEQVKTIHSYAVRNGCELAGFAGTMLVDVYAKCGSLVEARHVFEKLHNRDVVSWTSMILAYAQMGEGEVALQLYTQMQEEGVVPNARAFVGALKACSSLASCEEGRKVDRIIGKGWCLEQVRAIHSAIEEGEVQWDVYVGNMLVDAYAKCGSLVDARLVFEKMPHRDIVTWNAMILGYAQMEEGEEALHLFAQMQELGVGPVDRTFVGALQACGSVAGLEKGKEVHAQIAEGGLHVKDSYVASSLIDMYGKCGSMVDAQKVFDALSTRDIVTWSALIAGYTRQGESNLVFDLFEMMKQAGVQPNSVTFLSVLTVCSHVGLVDKGREYFEAMTRDFGITPTIEHYTCMVDLLGRAGQVDKAMAMARTLEPDSVLWRSLLGACRKWKHMELGRQAFKCMMLGKNEINQTL